MDNVAQENSSISHHIRCVIPPIAPEQEGMLCTSVSVFGRSDTASFITAPNMDGFQIHTELPH